MKTVPAEKAAITRSATTGSHHAASPAMMRPGIATTDTIGTKEAILRAVPLRAKLAKYTSMIAVVIGEVVDWRSSVREASAPATAKRHARAKKPTVKKSTNQTAAVDSAGRNRDHLV